MNYQYPHLLILLLCISAGSPAAEELVFPPTPIEPETHIYELAAEDPAPLDINALVDDERLAATLLELLAVPAKSCQESLITKAAAALFARIGAPMGIEVTIDALPEQVAELRADKRRGYYCNSGSTAPESGNLYAFIAGDPALPAWNLSVHLDTNQLSFDEFERDGDLIRPGPGTPLGADDKAGIAIISELLRIIREHNLHHGDIRIVGLVAEEDNAAGARLVAAEAFKGDILISIDGTNPNVIGRAAPTMYSGYITVRSQTSHPAMVERKSAVSACAVGARILTEAGFSSDAHPPGRPDVVLHSYFNSCGIDRQQFTAKGEPTASYKYNTISPFWTATWQMRNLEGDDAAKELVQHIKATMERVCAEAARDRTAVECAISGTDKPKLTGYVIAEQAPAIRLLQAGFDQTGKDAVRITARQFGAFNGNYIKQRFGEEMLIVGTGADQIHTNQETVSISGMARVTRGVLAAMLESYRYRRAP